MTILRGLVGLAAASGWLLLLEATEFSAVTVCAGLLAALYIIGRD